MELTQSSTLQPASQLLHWIITEDAIDHSHSFMDTECLGIVAFTCYNSSTFLPSARKKSHITLFTHLHCLPGLVMKRKTQSLLEHSLQPSSPQLLILFTVSTLGPLYKPQQFLINSTIFGYKAYYIIILYLCVSAFQSIFIKLGMNVMPLEAPSLYILISYT